MTVAISGMSGGKILCDFKSFGYIILCEFILKGVFNMNTRSIVNKILEGADVRGTLSNLSNIPVFEASDEYVSIKTIKKGDVIKVSPDSEAFMVNSVDLVPIEKADNSVFVLRDIHNVLKVFDSNASVILVDTSVCKLSLFGTNISDSKGKKGANNIHSFVKEVRVNDVICDKLSEIYCVPGDKIFISVKGSKDRTIWECVRTNSDIGKDTAFGKSDTCYFIVPKTATGKASLDIGSFTAPDPEDKAYLIRHIVFWLNESTGWATLIDPKVV